MTLLTEPIFIVVACIAAISALLSLYLIVRVVQLTKGADGKSLEGTIRSLLATTTAHSSHIETLETHVSTIEHKMRSVVRNVQTHRFDPFEGSSGSGKQSFALALLDDEGNGAVISSLHAHDKVRVFAKPIQQFTSPHELSDEEKRVIASARS